MQAHRTSLHVALSASDLQHVFLLFASSSHRSEPDDPGKKHDEGEGYGNGQVSPEARRHYALSLRCLEVEHVHAEQRRGEGGG